ncbi:MAG: hypothetical protein K6T83_19920 [Alicyclobacillus sp.]|nr:hypothetical protein [Alicyclobacillus sp.]
MGDWWVESHQSMARHPKTRRLARVLGEEVPTVIGRIHLLWWWCVDYAADGDLTKYSYEDLADAMMWNGEPEIIINALAESGWLDRDGDVLRVHEWEHYTGRLIAIREREAQRKRETRQREAQRNRTRPADVASVGRPGDVPRTSARTEQDRTGQHGSTSPDQTEQYSNTDRCIDNVFSSFSELDNVIDWTPIDTVLQSYGYQSVGDLDRANLLPRCVQYGVEWVAMALMEALDRKVPRLSYIDRILQNWRADGVPRCTVSPSFTKPAGQYDPRYEQFYKLFPDLQA